MQNISKTYKTTYYMDGFFSISSKNVQKIPEYLIYYLFLSLY